MAIFSRIAIAATAFASLAVARPLAVRDVPSVVTETAYTTVDVLVTLWVDENGKPLSTVAQGGNVAAPTPAANTPANNPADTPWATWSPSPAAGSPKVIQSALPSTSQPAVVPTTTAAPQLPAFTPAPSQPPTSQSPSPSPSPSSQTPAAAAPTNKAQSGQTGGSVTGSSAASCQGEGNACSGDITHWDGGLGACGWNVDTSSDMQIALPWEFMGTASNNNPYCGKSVTIQNPNTGNTVQAKVGDKCMGCTGRSIDLTDALFNAIGGGCDGRCSNFVWWLN